MLAGRLNERGGSPKNALSMESVGAHPNILRNRDRIGGVPYVDNYIRV